VFRSQPYGSLHVALVVGDLVEEGPIPLVRVQVASPAGDLFGRTALLEASLAAIREEGRGAFVYMHVFDGGQDGSRILKQLQARLAPVDFEARPDSEGANRTLREFGIGAQILVGLGITRMRLMTNHPRKIVGLDAYGIEVSGTVPIDISKREHGGTLVALQQFAEAAQNSE
jgi:3,4-dihydroxy 2-butanone 4-phosphate synthase/GTP cyclohydrolase II